MAPARHRALALSACCLAALEGCAPPSVRHELEVAERVSATASTTGTEQPVVEPASSSTAEPTATDPEPPTAPTARLELGVERVAPFTIRPLDGVRFACAPASCLAVWVEGHDVLAVPLTPDAPLPSAPTTVLRGSGPARVSVEALVAHPEGFAFVRTTSDTLERASLELVVVDAAGALVRRIQVGVMHGNSSDPALAMHGTEGMLAFPRTERSITFVAFSGDALGSRETSADAHATTPQLGHDGARFVATWIAWSRGGSEERLHIIGDSASLDASQPYLDRPGFGCAAGACLLVGARDGALRAVSLRGAEMHERVLVEPSGYNAVAEVLPHSLGFLVLARLTSGVRAWVLDPDAVSIAEPQIEAGAQLGALAWRESEHYVALRVSPPADYAPMDYPCPGDESSTCMEVPDHYTLALRSVVVRDVH